MARRFADNPEVHVLVLETGGPDDVQPVMEVIQWSS